MTVTLVLLAALAAAPAPEPAPFPVERFRVEVSERTRAGGTVAAVLVATRSRWTTRWVLRCTADGDASTTGEYRGVDLAEQGWIEGTVKDVDAIGKFTLALGSPLWMASLPGCPRSGIPVIRKLP
ncbi:hypothetical protein ASG60_08050 [Methylobacterium sp. Leaf469]|uniref:hypothetical protein n=1 Tax=Methylobacterium sp. Leaf469 TaxID=1736387 RepID=UPI0006F87663|nr:hypothetical protein [Methylobacterium sp. Leaf469]KQT93315.1 hypothetical protein ASG60_08050 [Methylobacterium sp. Leaf469]